MKNNQLPCPKSQSILKAGFIPAFFYAGNTSLYNKVSWNKFLIQKNLFFPKNPLLQKIEILLK